MAIFPGSAIPSAVSDYEIDNSLRFNNADSAYLSRTPSVAGNRKTWTWSGWVKRCAADTNAVLMEATDGSTPRTVLSLYDGDLYFYGTGTAMNVSTVAEFRDPSAWYHIVFVFDTTESVAADRTKIYVNGVQVTNLTLTTSPAEDSEWAINNTGEHNIGRSPNLNSEFLNGYLAEVYFIDGTAYDADDFGELSSTTNQWIPLDSDDVKDAVAFGTNGFFQKYGSTELANSFTDSHHIWTCPDGVTTVDYLVVGGGGGGGHSADYSGGGGGAGGYRAGTGFSVTPGTEYTITVGAGGAAGSSSLGTSGGDSTFSTITSAGGGGGGFQPTTPGGLSGGSGGGGAFNAGAGGSGNTPSTSPVQGYAGGSALSDGVYAAAGGGGGAGEVGEDGSQAGSAAAQAGDGGDGVANSITGSSVYYAGGGAGCANTLGVASGGNGGGGDTSTAGTNDLGGGGGGGANAEITRPAGAGGSGIVIIDDGTTVTSFTGSVHTITANGDVTNTRAVRKVGDSSILFDGTGDYLTIPDSTDWDFPGDFTIEMWFRTGTINQQGMFFSHKDYGGATDGTGQCQMYLYNNNNIYWDVSSSGTYETTGFSSTGISADAWHHIAFVRDFGSWYKIFLDGVLQVTNTTDVSLDITGEQTTVSIGKYNNYSGSLFDGYLDEIRVSKGIARYTANFTDFGQDGGTISNPTPFTADEYTKLLIHSNWDGGLGADSSGNYNTFTPTNLVATDQMIDTPTNNFATINPLIKSYSTPNTISEGNLKIDQADDYNQWASTWAVKTGKWYCEFRCGDAGAAGFGIIADNATKWWDNQLSPQNGSGHILYTKDGVKNIDGTETSYGDGFTDGDIIGMAVNLTDSEVTYYKNGTVQNSGTAISFSGGITSANLIIPGAMTKNGTSYFNGGSDSSFSGTETAQGNQDGNDKGDFYYAPPSGYLALCTDNLSTPEIALPEENFNTLIWTGDGTSTRAITGVGFTPDLTWGKNRDTAGTYHFLMDSVRPVGYNLYSNASDAQATNATILKTLDSDGFTVGSGDLNTNTKKIVAWNWKAGGTPTADNSAGAGNTPTAGSVKIDGSNLGSALAGTIAATRLSANTTSGFSIVKYTGNDTAGATLAHGLGVAPEFVQVKNLTIAQDWYGTSPELGTTGDTTGGLDEYYMIQLNSDGGKADFGQDNVFGFTSTTFSVGSSGVMNGVNNSSYSYVAYLFASIEGYSKVGIYEGNGDTDGPFIYTGFSPKFFLSKNIDNAQNWTIQGYAPGYNPEDRKLIPNETGAEGTGSNLDFLSNGVKWRVDYNEGNRSGDTFLYMAFAESPFKTANAR